MPSIKAVIFDLNGVFIQSPLLSKRFESDFKVPTDKFLPVLSNIMDKVRQPGAGDLFDYWAQYFKEWNVPLDKQGFYDYWFKAETENKEMTSYARHLKQDGWRLFILSNNFKERADYYRKSFPFLNELFEESCFSFETGFVKPDERCFTSILQKYRIQPTSCFYFDDSEKNIAVANKLSIHAYKFEGLEQVKMILSKVN